MSLLYEIISFFPTLLSNYKLTKDKRTKEAIHLHKNINNFIIRNFDKDAGRLGSICYIKELSNESQRSSFSKILEKYKSIITDSSLNEVEREALLREIEIKISLAYEPLGLDEMYNYYKNSIDHIRIYQNIRNINYKNEFKTEKIKFNEINNFLNILSKKEIKLIEHLHSYIEDYHELKEKVYYCYVKIYEDGLNFDKFEDVEDFKNMETGIQLIYSGYEYSMNLFFVDYYEKYFKLFRKIDNIVKKDKVYNSLLSYSLLENYIHIKKQYEL